MPFDSLTTLRNRFEKSLLSLPRSIASEKIRTASQPRQGCHSLFITKVAVVTAARILYCVEKLPSRQRCEGYFQRKTTNKSGLFDISSEIILLQSGALRICHEGLRSQVRRERTSGGSATGVLESNVSDYVFHVPIDLGEKINVVVHFRGKNRFEISVRDPRMAPRNLPPAWPTK